MTKKIAPIFAVIALVFSCGNPETPPQQTDTVKKDTLAVKPPAGPSRIYGIDISSYQGDEIDFLNKNGDSLTFIICRATLGITFTDPDFKNNWAQVAERGFVRGAYHFYMCNDDPKAQAQHYLTTIGTLGPNDLPPILDFEEAGLGGVTDVKSIQNGLLAFLMGVEAHSGKTPIIYVSPDFANIYLNDPAFAKYPLYVADYNGENQPTMPETWKSGTWTFWQKNDSTKVDGNVNDFDVFNGNRDALNTVLRANNALQ